MICDNKRCNEIGSLWSTLSLTLFISSRLSTHISTNQSTEFNPFHRRSLTTHWMDSTELFFLNRRSFFSRPSFASLKTVHGVPYTNESILDRHFTCKMKLQLPQQKGLIESDYILCGSRKFASVKWTVIIEHRLLSITVYCTHWKFKWLPRQMHHMKIEHRIVLCQRNPLGTTKTVPFTSILIFVYRVNSFLH